jgi:DNA-binding NtrC family response regulator/polyferredoxin
MEPNRDTTWSELAQDPFKDLPESFRQAILEKGVVQQYPAGATIAAPGDAGDKIRFLLSGAAVVVFQEQDRDEIPVENLGPGDMIGEISHLTGRRAPLNSTVNALEPCQVLELGADAFDQIMRDYPSCAVSVLRNLALKVIRLDQSVYRKTRKKRALQALISRQDHLFPDYFVSETVRRRVKGRLEELAFSRAHVLVAGETGVGKEFLAHALYEMSPHFRRVFIYVDLLRSLGDSSAMGEYCLIPQDTADATEKQMKLFFGYEDRKRAGDGVTETPGYLELTEEGTLVVRGIEQLTPTMQTRLLEALKTGVFRRVHGKAELNTDFRLIGTTNLEFSEVSADKHPLLTWLLENSLIIPPLRKRRKEIPALAQHYVDQYCGELRKSTNKLPKETLKTLLSYSWPGNDLELATTLKRAVLLSEEGIIRPGDISLDMRRVEGGGKINLLRVSALRATVRSPLFPAIFQSAAAPFFFILLVLLFLGPADPVSNPGGLFSWAVGWPMMVFGSFLWARFWCSLCPMGTMSYLAKKIVSWDIPFPAYLKYKSDWIVAGSALFIIWLEIATNMRSSPVNTGLLLVTICLLATAVSVIFERQSWCRYMCPLGGMMGVFAKVSPIELRADRNVCSSQCTSNECYTGTKGVEGCPFGQMAPTIRSNRFCKICGNCVKNCPYSAINLNLRIPGSEIWEMRQTGAITAFLVISMFGGLLTDMLHKMPAYDGWSVLLGDWPHLLKFTLFFGAILGAANLLVLCGSFLSSRVSSEPVKENFGRHGLALLPLVLTGFMAFHLYYLINLGVYFPILLWQTFQFEVFRQLVITVPPAWTLFFQQVLIIVGLVGSVVVAMQLSRGKHRSFSKVFAEFLPHAAVACIFGYALMSVMRDSFY